MGLEYVVLGQQVKDYRVEPWTPADSLAWLKAMAWDLRGDYDDELTRARLAGRVPAAQITELYPPYPYGTERAHPVRAGLEAGGSAGPASAVPGPLPTSGVPRGPHRPAAQSAYAAAQRVLDRGPLTLVGAAGIGSNSWVVGPEKSSTGKPLLANDPHLGVGIPGIWHQVGLHCRSVGPSVPSTSAGSPSPGCRAWSSATTSRSPGA